MNRFFTTIFLLLLALSTLAEVKLMPSPAVQITAQEPPAILEQPDGTTQLMQRTCREMYAFMNMAFVRDLTAGSLEVTISDNGDVYFKNFISALSPALKNVWLKGHLEGDKLSMVFPQVAAYESYNGHLVAESAYLLDNNMDLDEPSLPTLSASQVVTFTYKDGAFTQDDNRIIGLGLIEGPEFQYLGYGNAANEITPFEAVANVAPTDVNFEKWAMTFFGGNRYVEVGIKGEKIYVKHLHNDIPELVAIGEIKGDKVTFAADQFMGVNPTSTRLIYFVPLVNKPETNPSTGEEEDNILKAENIEFLYDSLAQSLTVTNEMTGFLLNNGTTEMDYLAAYLTPKFFYDPNYGKPAIPASPIFTGYKELPEDEWQVYGKVELKFLTPWEDDKGNILDSNNLYYSLYVDNDQLVTLKADDYQYLSQDLTEIAATYDDEWDFMLDGMEHTLYLWFNDFSRVGVQTIYKIEGESYRSPIVYFSPSSVPEVSAARKIISVEYHDLMGRKVDNPDAGFFVKTILYNDGQSKSYKMRLIH